MLNGFVGLLLGSCVILGMDFVVDLHLPPSHHPLFNDTHCGKLKIMIHLLRPIGGLWAEMREFR